MSESGIGQSAEVRHKPSCHVVSESEAVDHLDEEVVRNGVERLRDVHCYGSARGLALVEARDHPSRTRWTGGGPALVSSLPGRAVRWGGRSDPGLEASLLSKSGL